jgi:zinc transporter ZupT
MWITAREIWISLEILSFVEIFALALELLHKSGTQWPEPITVGAFFAGIALIYAIDMLIPNAENPHEMRSVEEWAKYIKRQDVLHRFHQYNEERGNQAFSDTYWYYFDKAEVPKLNIN